MNKHIIHKLLNHSAETGADSLVINRTNHELVFSYKLPDGGNQSFILPKHLGTKILNSLYQLLNISDEQISSGQTFKLTEVNYQLNFKISSISNKDGEKVIIHILKNKKRSLNLKQLGFQKENLNILKKINKLKSGLVIVSAPENNGKSTTLRALLNEINSESINAYCLEKNPKELIKGINYLIPNANNWDKILKHDCDLIIFDDLRNDDDWIKVIKAANTGRLLIVATNAQSSLEIIFKILKLELPLRFKINSLKTIINQRLVNLDRNPKLKAARQLSESRKQIAVSEVINFDSTIKKYLLDNGHDYQKKIFWIKLDNLLSKNGFKPLKQDLAKKIKEKVVKK